MAAKIYRKPRDRSLEAFKEWFKGHNNPYLKSTNAGVTRPWIDEKGWVANWRAFWAKVDGSPNRPGSQPG